MLSFRLFADDANIFYASKTSKDLEAVMNSEPQKVINYCNLNKLSLNMRKTNFMIITSPQKPAIHNINILNIESKTSIKYLGIYLDEHLNWKTQIAHVQGKLTKKPWSPEPTKELPEFKVAEHSLARAFADAN